MRLCWTTSPTCRLDVCLPEKYLGQIFCLKRELRVAHGVSLSWKMVSMATKKLRGLVLYIWDRIETGKCNGKAPISVQWLASIKAVATLGWRDSGSIGKQQGKLDRCKGRLKTRSAFLKELRLKWCNYNSKVAHATQAKGVKKERPNLVRWSKIIVDFSVKSCGWSYKG